MVNMTVAECAVSGLVPVTVIEYVPTRAVPALMVNVALRPVLTDRRLTRAVAPAGRPETVSDRRSAVPEVIAVRITDLPEAPCARDTLDGAALIEKLLAAARMVSVTVVACAVSALVPVTVIG